MAVESLGSTGDDRGFEDLAQRLREESRRLAARYPPRELTLQQLKGTRSARRRWLAVRAAAAVLLVAAGMLAWSALNPPAEHPQPDQPAPARLADAGRGEPAGPRDTPTTPVDPKRDKPAQATLALRFVITAPDDKGGRRVVGTGLYIPERRRQVTFEQLSPAEQYAVMRALGAERKPQWQL